MSRWMVTYRYKIVKETRKIPQQILEIVGAPSGSGIDSYMWDVRHEVMARCIADKLSRAPFMCDFPASVEIREY